MPRHKRNKKHLQPKIRKIFHDVGVLLNDPRYPVQINRSSSFRRLFYIRRARDSGGAKKSGKDNSGNYVFVKNENGQKKLDKNGHLVIDHDLHNHGGELPDGVAEKFIEWAKGEKLSFWK